MKDWVTSAAVVVIWAVVLAWMSIMPFIGLLYLFGHIGGAKA